MIVIIGHMARNKQLQQCFTCRSHMNPKLLLTWNTPFFQFQYNRSKFQQIYILYISHIAAVRRLSEPTFPRLIPSQLYSLSQAILGFPATRQILENSAPSFYYMITIVSIWPIPAVATNNSCFIPIRVSREIKLTKFGTKIGSKSLCKNDFKFPLSYLNGIVWYN